MDDVKRQIVERLASAEKLLILTHARPDGDGLGSMAALSAAARAAGKTARALVPDKLPPRYEFLFPEGLPAGADEFGPLADEADAVVVLDTCAFSQLDGLDEPIRQRRRKVLVVDHHTTGDSVGELQWVDSSAAAAGVMTAELIEALDWPLPAEAAEALMTAITTDTGWLRFSNTDARCLRAAAKLVESGIRPDELYQRLYQADRPQRLRLMRCVLDSLHFHCDDRIAAMTIRQADFAETGARPDETENLVNEPLRAGCVEVALLLVENTDCIRASLRSRGAVNVAEIAARFGGGGHARAAGLRRAEDIDVLAKQLVDACTEALCSP